MFDLAFGAMERVELDFINFPESYGALLGDFCSLSYDLCKLDVVLSKLCVL